MSDASNVAVRVRGINDAAHDSTLAAVARHSTRLAEATNASPTLAKILSKVTIGVFTRALVDRADADDYGVRTHVSGSTIVVTVDDER